MFGDGALAAAAENGAGPSGVKNLGSASAARSQAGGWFRVPIISSNGKVVPRHMRKFQDATKKIAQSVSYLNDSLPLAGSFILGDTGCEHLVEDIFGSKGAVATNGE
jgi:hypothetical protein